MNKEEFLNFFEENEDQFIPGIYNYCDRWCERCPMTTKCSLYAMEFQISDGKKEESDIENEMFWEELGDMMKLTMELLTDLAEEEGIDLDSIDTDEVVEEHEEWGKKADEHILAKLSLEYSEKNRQWFDNNEDAVKKKENELKTESDLEISPENTADKYLKIKDFMDVIKWYTFQIHIKIKRALMPGMQDPEYEDPIQNDRVGSAKVALIGTERSITAWFGMLQHFEEQEDEILDLLVVLEKIRKGILEEFPNVNEFVRPGFDA